MHRVATFNFPPSTLNIRIALSMLLSTLDLRGYRNLLDQRLEFPPEGIALIGDNGQGKTNLLEAIYYLEIFRSFRGAADEQLVRFG